MIDTIAAPGCCSGSCEDERPLFLWGQDRVLHYCEMAFAEADREKLIALYLADDFHLLRCENVAVGSLQSVEINFRALMAHGLARGAAAFVLVHNHPSGDPTPSRDDILVTQRIRRVSAELDMPLLDHFVIASGGMRRVGYW